MTKTSTFTYDDLSKEINQRFNRLSGGAAILALRELLEDGKTEKEHQIDRLQSVQSEIVKIPQPTAGRTDIVKDIVALIDVYIDVDSETANEKLKNAKLSYDEKIKSGEIVDKTTKEDNDKVIDILSKSLNVSTDNGGEPEILSDEECKERQEAIDALDVVNKEDATVDTTVKSEEIKQTSKAFTGKKTKLTKAFLANHKIVDFLVAGEFAYIDGSTMTAFIASKRFAESDKNITELTESAIFVFDKPLQLN